MAVASWLVWAWEQEDSESPKQLDPRCMVRDSWCLTLYPSTIPNINPEIKVEEEQSLRGNEVLRLNGLLELCSRYSNAWVACLRQ